MKILRYLVSAIFLILILAACKSTIRPVTPPLVTADDTAEIVACGGIKKLHTVGGVYLAGQPTEEDWSLLADRGVRTVLNLRHGEELGDFNEAQAVTEAGMRYVHLPFNGAAELTDEIFDEVRLALKNHNGAVVIHCGSANRVGGVWLAYRVLDTGLNWDTALAEAKTIGLRNPDYERRAREYVEQSR